MAWTEFVKVMTNLGCSPGEAAIMLLLTLELVALRKRVTEVETVVKRHLAVVLQEKRND